MKFECHPVPARCHIIFADARRREDGAAEKSVERRERKAHQRDVPRQSRRMPARPPTAHSLHAKVTGLIVVFTRSHVHPRNRLSPSRRTPTSLLFNAAVMPFSIYRPPYAHLFDTMRPRCLMECRCALMRHKKGSRAQRSAVKQPTCACCARCAYRYAARILYTTLSMSQHTAPGLSART